MLLRCRVLSPCLGLPAPSFVFAEGTISFPADLETTLLLVPAASESPRM